VALWGLGLTIVVLLPFVSSNYVTNVADEVGLFLLMGLGLNIVVGYAGLLDLGYVAFYAIGAYSVAVLTSPQTGIELGFWTALPIAVAFATLSGILLGVPVLRTHGDYLAIITLGFGEIIRILAISDALKPAIGGAQGIKAIPKSLDVESLTLPVLGHITPSFQQEVYFPIVIACAAFTYVAWRLRNSRYGRSWMAIREDEPVAEALGVNLVLTKLFAFAAGAAMAGTAGAFFASKLQTVFPTSFSLFISINVLVMIIVGGMGSIPGVYVGALVLVGLPEVLREFDDYRLLIYGALLVFMMLRRPEGLWPATLTKRELHRSRSVPTVTGASSAAESAP
jgi:branched-chain amino acid transport system permease protein